MQLHHETRRKSCQLVRPQAPIIYTGETKQLQLLVSVTTEREEVDESYNPKQFNTLLQHTLTVIPNSSFSQLTLEHTAMISFQLNNPEKATTTGSVRQYFHYLNKSSTMQLMKIRSVLAADESCTSAKVSHKIIHVNDLNIAVITVQQYFTTEQLLLLNLQKTTGTRSENRHLRHSFSTFNILFDTLPQRRRDLVHRVIDESLCARKYANVVVLAMPTVEHIVVHKLLDYVDAFVAVCLLHDVSSSNVEVSELQAMRLTVLNGVDCSVTNHLAAVLQLRLNSSKNLDATSYVVSGLSRVL